MTQVNGPQDRRITGSSRTAMASSPTWSEAPNSHADQAKHYPKSSRPNPGISHPHVPSMCPAGSVRDASRSPHAERLAVSIARIYGRHLGRRAWRLHGPRPQPSDYLTVAAWWTGVCVIAAALIVASDMAWPLWLA